jgi:hypothetical protein
MNRESQQSGARQTDEKLLAPIRLAYFRKHLASTGAHHRHFLKIPDFLIRADRRRNRNTK